MLLASHRSVAIVSPRLNSGSWKLNVLPRSYELLGAKIPVPQTSRCRQTTRTRTIALTLTQTLVLTTSSQFTKQHKQMQLATCNHGSDHFVLRVDDWHPKAFASA